MCSALSSSTAGLPCKTSGGRSGHTGGPFDFARQPAGDSTRVTQLLGRQSPQILPSVEHAGAATGIRIGCRLTIHGARHDQTVQLLERPTVGDELRGPASRAARDESAALRQAQNRLAWRPGLAEVHLPDAIDEHSRRERILGEAIQLAKAQPSPASSACLAGDLISAGFGSRTEIKPASDDLASVR